MARGVSRRHGANLRLATRPAYEATNKINFSRDQGGARRCQAESGWHRGAAGFTASSLSHLVGHPGRQVSPRLASPSAGRGRRRRAPRVNSSRTERGLAGLGGALTQGRAGEVERARVGGRRVSWLKRRPSKLLTAGRGGLGRAGASLGCANAPKARAARARPARPGQIVNPSLAVHDQMYTRSVSPCGSTLRSLARPPTPPRHAICELHLKPI